MDIVLRALTVFFFVFLLTRVAGRRELGSLEPFDLIMLVVIGDLVQQALTQDDYSVVGALLAGSTIGLLTVVVSYVHYRFPRLRPVLEGEPVILLEDGRPIESILRRERITVDELAEAARQQQGLASLDDVQWAVLETSGQISVIPKQQ
jgi:uncharacterized membrane protein YcaP (DUF421 family)